MRCEDVGAPADGRLVSPSAQRNRKPITQVLCEILPQVGVVLEISSGTGQHVVHFARSMPGITWQPSERDAGCLQSISAWLASEGLANVRAPLHLDVDDAVWPVSSADAIVCINMIHIAPWRATRALMRGAGVTLRAGGLLYLYGPYRRQGRHTSASNLAFDAQLRATNALWGVRNLEDVTGEANAAGFEAVRTIEMPANNLSVVFRKV